MTKPIALLLKLFRPVQIDGCNWTFDARRVVITLEKCKDEPWSRLVQE